MRERDGAERAACLVFGAREVDESQEGPPLFRRFEKDWAAQREQCRRHTRDRGYQHAGSTVFSVRQPSPARVLEWADQPGCEVVLVASARLLERMRAEWPDWDRMVERLDAAGARVEAVPLPEPRYGGEELPDG